MPFAPEVIAVFMPLTISLTFEFSDPVHWYVHPRSLQASSAPYLVGTKNGFVVTWLTSTNFSFLVTAKIPLPPSWAAVAVAVAFALSGLLEPQAGSMALAIPAAPPVRAARRLSARMRVAGVSSCLLSAHSRRSNASWTGSSSDIQNSSSVDGRMLAITFHASQPDGGRPPPQGDRRRLSRPSRT